MGEVEEYKYIGITIEAGKHGGFKSMGEIKKYCILYIYRVQNRRSLLAKCECERLRSSTQVSTLARNIEYQKAKRHRGCLHYDLFIAQL